MTVSFTVTEWTLIQLYTERIHAHPAQWIRTVALHSVPNSFKASVVRALESADPELSAINALDQTTSSDQAQSLDDRMDELRGYRTRSRPAHVPVREDSFLRTIREAPSDPNHSCWHLRKIFPYQRKKGECQGTCGSRNPEASGRVCHFNSSVAHNCPYFEPRKIRSKKSLD